jgi:very-short-patch-repair endonuclease
MEEESHLISIPGSLFTISTKIGYLHYQMDDLQDGKLILTIGVYIRDIHINVDGLEIIAEVKRSASYKIPDGTNLSDVDIKNIFFDNAFTKVNQCESPLEAHFYVIALDTIPELEPQFEVDRYRLDFAIPGEKVAIEIDGHEFHKTKEQRTRDAKRERYLQAQGWRVIRFTGTEIFENVFKCVEEVKSLVNIFGKKQDGWFYSKPVITNKQ